MTDNPPRTSSVHSRCETLICLDTRRSDEEATHFLRPHITHPSPQIANAKDAEADQPS